MNNPWIVPSFKFVPKEVADRKKAQDRANAAKALADQTYQAPKKSGGGLFGNVIKAASGLGGDIVGGVEDIGSAVSNAAQAVTSPPNIANVGKIALHKTLQGAGIALNAPVKYVTGPMAAEAVKIGKGALHGDIGDIATIAAAPIAGPIGAMYTLEGRTAANYSSAKKSYEGFEQNPDVNPYLKTAVSTGLNPVSYVGGGGAAALNLGLNELNTLIQEKGANIPVWKDLSPDVQQAILLGSSVVAGKVGEHYGITPKTVGKAGIKGVEGTSDALVNAADKSGIVPKGAIPGAAMTDLVDPGERIYHGTPYEIPAGQLKGSAKGDLGNLMGMHFTRDPKIANEYVTGDSLNVSEHPAAIAQRSKIAREGGQQVYRYAPNRTLKLLEADSRVTPEEMTRITQAVLDVHGQEAANKFISYTSPGDSGRQVTGALNDVVGPKDVGWREPTTELDNTAKVLDAAGFDGMSSGGAGKSSHDQITIFRPNDLVKENLTPPDIIKGNIAHDETVPTQSYLYNPSGNKPKGYVEPLISAEEVYSPAWLEGASMEQLHQYWDDVTDPSLPKAKADIWKKNIQDAISQKTEDKIAGNSYKPGIGNPYGHWDETDLKAQLAEYAKEENYNTLNGYGKQQQILVQKALDAHNAPLEKIPAAPKNLKQADIAEYYSLTSGEKDYYQKQFAKGISHATIIRELDANPVLGTMAYDLKQALDKSFGKTEDVQPAENSQPPLIAGGANPETLVTPRTPTVGLTNAEKIGNVLTSAKQFIIRHGVKNDAIATPIANEYLRINNVLKTQTNQIGKMAQRAEQLIPIDPKTLEMDLSKVTTPGQRSVVEALQRSMEAYDATLTQFGTKFKSIQDFAKKVRNEAGQENKTFSDIMQEYGNAIANRVSDKWLKNQIATLGEDIKGTEEVSGSKIPVKTVPGISPVKLPPELADVITKAVRKVHPPATGEASKLFSAVNNTLRGLWATGDASFVGIQQLPTWADNPVLAAKIVRASLETLKDPTSFAKWSIEHDRAAYGVRPTITKWIESSLHIAQDTGAGTDLGGLPGRVKAIPVVGKLMGAADRLFADSGNINRVALADALYDNWKNGGIINGLDKVTRGSSEADVLTAIAKAANRATGYADTGLGGSLGSALFFAPRFLQSQLETVVKAVSDGSLEGKVARRQLMKMAGVGIGITVAANAARGEDTVFDPRSSNFLRIRNVGGADLSIFGPWDTLIRGLVNSSPHVDQNGDWTFGDPKALVRTKLSPVLSTAVDLLTGSNLIGQKVGIQLPTDVQNVKTDVNFVKNLSLPFSLRNIGQEPAAISAVGALGIKGSPLTGSEQLDNTLENAGISKSDPDYLIKRKEYLAQHPNAIPAATSDAFKKTQNIQQDIAARRKANDDLAASGGETLAQFKDNRSTLLQEQRDKLSVLLGQSTKNASSKQQDWLNSYFKLFDQNQDPITHKVDSTTFDTAVAKWTNDNGGQALDFVNRYMGTGLNTVESAYYNDLRKLDAAGYFNLPRYQNMHSGLTDDQINSYKQKVDAARAADPKLQAQPYSVTVQNVLSNLTTSQRIDIANSNKSAYQSKDLAKFKATHRKELMWFNPNADWNSYQNTVNGSPNTSGKGTLKLKVKTALK